MSRGWDVLVCLHFQLLKVWNFLAFYKGWDQLDFSETFLNRRVSLSWKLIYKGMLLLASLCTNQKFMTVQFNIALFYTFFLHFDHLVLNSFNKFVNAWVLLSLFYIDYWLKNGMLQIFYDRQCVWLFELSINLIIVSRNLCKLLFMSFWCFDLKNFIFVIVPSSNSLIIFFHFGFFNSIFLSINLHQFDIIFRIK